MEGTEKAQDVAGPSGTNPEGRASPAEKEKQDDPKASPGEKEKQDDPKASPGEKEKQDDPKASPGEKEKQNDPKAPPGEKEKQDDPKASPGEKEKQDDPKASPGEKERQGDPKASPGEKERQDDPKASPGEKEKQDEPGSGSGARRSLQGESPMLTSGAENEAGVADHDGHLYLEYFPETGDKDWAARHAAGSDTPGMSALPSEPATPDGAGTPEPGSTSSFDTDDSHGPKDKKKSRRKKRSKNPHERHRERVVLNTRTNILRDPYNACLKQPFKGADKASDDQKAPGKDHVVAFVTSTSVDGHYVCPSVIAAEKMTQQDIDLVKENATLNALLSNFIAGLELHHELKIRRKNNDKAVRRLNGIIKPAAKRKGISFNIPDTNLTTATSPNLGSEAESSLWTHKSPVRFQEPQMPWPQPSLLNRASASPVSGIELGQDKSGGDDDKRPQSAAALGTFEAHKASLGERPSDETPLIFFSSSLTDSSERQQLAGSFFKGSSGYAGDSETESFVDGRGCLEAAFGGGSFSDDYGHTLWSPVPNRRNTHSDTSSADRERGETSGCWHDRHRQPIKMVSKYIQTDCRNGPSLDSSGRDLEHAPLPPRLKTTTNSLQKPCSLQRALLHRQATGGHSEASSTEELEKIFSACSTSSARAGEDESGRVKGMLHDRNFSVTSSSGSSGKGGQQSASIAQPGPFDGGTINSTADGPNRAGVPVDIEDGLKTGH